MARNQVVSGRWVGGSQTRAAADADHVVALNRRHGSSLRHCTARHVGRQNDIRPLRRARCGPAGPVEVGDRAISKRSPLHARPGRKASANLAPEAASMTGIWRRREIRPRRLTWASGRCSASRCLHLRRRTDRRHQTRAPTRPHLKNKEHPFPTTKLPTYAHDSG